MARYRSKYGQTRTSYEELADLAHRQLDVQKDLLHNLCEIVDQATKELGGKPDALLLAIGSIAQRGLQAARIESALLGMIEGLEGRIKENTVSTLELTENFHRRIRRLESTGSPRPATRRAKAQ